MNGMTTEMALARKQAARLTHEYEELPRPDEYSSRREYEQAVKYWDSLYEAIEEHNHRYPDFEEDFEDLYNLLSPIEEEIERLKDLIVQRLEEEEEEDRWVREGTEEEPEVKKDE